MSTDKEHKSCDFSQRLHARWKATGLDQAQFAAALGQNLRKVRGWLRGPNRPDYENLIAIADYFGITVDELLRDLTPADRARLVLGLDLPALAEHLNAVSKAVDNARDLVDSVRTESAKANGPALKQGTPSQS